MTLNIPIQLRKVGYFVSLLPQKTKWRCNIRGILRRVSAEFPHRGAQPQSGAICAFCFPNMVLRVRLNFPGNEQTNDKQKFLRSLVSDWLLFHTARKFKFASRPSLIIPSSAFLYIASSCSFYILSFCK